LPVNDLLSIIVPVRNVEATLAARIEKLLDLAHDHGSRFEIVLVDDGSRDHTVDVARDLSRQYPQVVLIRHSRPLGLHAAVETGRRRVRGQRIVRVDARDFYQAELRRQRPTTEALRHLAEGCRRDGAHPILAPQRRWRSLLDHLRMAAVDLSTSKCTTVPTGHP
jgi:glycosyltransferase involved in cell wall biosynthesis